MAKYDTRRRYDYPPDENGLNYDSATATHNVRIYDSWSTDDSLRPINANIISRGNINTSESKTIYANLQESDTAYIRDIHTVSMLMRLLEQIKSTDSVSPIINNFNISGNIKFGELSHMAESLLSVADNIKLNSTSVTNASVNASDYIKIIDYILASFGIKVYDSVAFADKEPRKSKSDFLIGYTSDRDGTYKSVLPLGLNYDVERSEIPIMPPTENTYIDMPFVDGSMITHTKYSNRPFKIVAWSDEGLSIAQKEQLKCDITQFLNSMKEHSRQLTIQETGTTFDVKYSGQAVTQEGPSFLRVTMPFESGPYGYPEFQQEIKGNGILTNHGDTDMPFTNKISAGCVNPQFTIGSVEYKWSGTVPTGKTLIIDHEDLTCYLESSNGQRENVITQLTGEFQTVPKGGSVAITAGTGTANYLYTYGKEKVLWMKSGE